MLEVIGRGSPRRAEVWFVAALLAANAILGFLIAPHYGQSIDEAANLKYGELSLQSYLHPLNPYRDPVRQDKGPFYLMLWSFGSGAIARTVPGWLPVDAQHFVNFLTWQVALVSLYALARRIASRGASLAATLLFASQPLLFGHAFINQKDTPFMAFFAAAVVVGLAVMDKFRAPSAPGPDETPQEPSRGGLSPREVWAAWMAGTTKARRRAAGFAILAVVVVLARLAGHNPLRFWIEDLVRRAYSGAAWAPIQGVFDQVAANAANTPLSAYIARAFLVVDVGTAVLALFLAVAALVASGWFWREVEQKLRAWEAVRIVFPAATILGMAVAIRSAALLAGLLVGAYALARDGRRSFRAVVAYALLAGFVAFILWPQLWESPTGWFQSSLENSLRFPEDHEVLFRGVMYDSTSLPAVYLPWLMALQFTLPAVVLMLVSLLWTARLGALGRRRRADLWVLLLWFLIPFGAVVALGVPIYNNFRHMLFITPPLFIMTSMVWDWIARWARTTWLMLALVAVVIAPGVVAIVRLHPYEYIYFNELTGGVRGAFGNYLLDSWCTAYRETMHFVNGASPQGARIAVWGPISTAAPFFRDDLVLVKILPGADEEDLDAFMVIGCSWATIDPAFFPDAPLRWTLERDGVPLAVVKLLGTGATAP